MRGAGDHLTIGERVAFYRRRRGLTQAVLAGLVGRSEDWLSKIERGERDIRRLDVLTDMARALRVTLGDLVGQPVLMEGTHSHDDNVPAIRDALMAPRRLSRRIFAGHHAKQWAPLDQTASLTDSAWLDYQHGQIGRVISALPFLIQSALALEEHSSSVARWKVSSRVHHLAATTLIKLGEEDLAWLAGERAMAAADQSDDPLVLASAARAATHALLAVGRFDDAIEMGRTAEQWLTQQLTADTPEALSLSGMLSLRMANAAGRHQDRALANEFLDRATDAADRLGEDANHWHTAFGPTNVRLHRVTTALDLGDLTFAVDYGSHIDSSRMPVERRVSLRLETARAQTLLAQDDAAVASILDAEIEAPLLVRHHPMVRETVRAVYKRAPVTLGGRSSEFIQLAERCRAIQ